MRWRAAVLAALRAAQAAVRRLSPAAGQRVVAGRAAGYRPFDPDVIAVDTAAERAVIRALERLGLHGTLLSEEAGERPLGRPRARGEPIYAVLDPSTEASCTGGASARSGSRRWASTVGTAARAPRA